MNRSTTRTTVLSGITFTIKNITLGDRKEFNRETAEIQSRIREIEIERGEITTEFNEAARMNRGRPCECAHPQEAEQPDKENPDKILAPGHFETTGACLHDGCACRAFKFDRDKDRQYARLGAQLEDIMRDELYPELVKRFLICIEGYAIDDAPVESVGQFVDKADPFLIEDVGRDIDRSRRLRSQESENLSSGTTSGAVETGSSPSGTAPPANETATILSATA